jgi:hypothetical protein
MTYSACWAKAVGGCATVAITNGRNGAVSTGSFRPTLGTWASIGLRRAPRGMEGSAYRPLGLAAGRYAATGSAGPHVGLDRSRCQYLPRACARKNLWMAPGLCGRLPRNANPEPYLLIKPRAIRRVHMPHRPYGIPSPKPRPTSSGPTRVEWSGGAIIGGIILIVIVLGFIMYEVTKIGTHARNTTTPTPHTTGKGNPSSGPAR